jgi:hypothetical protein
MYVSTYLFALSFNWRLNLLKFVTSWRSYTSYDLKSFRKYFIWTWQILSKRFQINKDDHSWNVAQEQRRLLQVTKHDAEILGNSNDLEITSKIIINAILTRL